MTAITRIKREWREIKGDCGACGHPGGWCTTDGEHIKCRRNSAGKPIRQRDGSTAWLFSISSLGTTVSVKAKKKDRPKLTKQEIALILKQQRTAINPQRLEKFAESLGVSVASLKAYGIGFDIQQGVWTFPMYDGDRKLVGIHHRSPDGTKNCRFGSRLGLFIPSTYEPNPVSVEPNQSILIFPEGLSDSCAAFDMGYLAFGRPSNSACIKEVARLLSGSRVRRKAVIFADNDETKYLPDGTPFWPGIEGGLALAEYAISSIKDIAFMLAPSGVKDLRGWRKAGCDEATFTAAVMSANTVTPEWLRRAWERLKEKKQQERRQVA